jgi:hypothetical protein
VSCAAAGGAGGEHVLVRDGEAGMIKIDDRVSESWQSFDDALHVHTFVPVVLFVTPTPDTRTWRSVGCGRCACGTLRMRGKA